MWPGWARMSGSAVLLVVLLHAVSEPVQAGDRLLALLAYTRLYAIHTGYRRETYPLAHDAFGLY